MKKKKQTSLLEIPDIDHETKENIQNNEVILSLQQMTTLSPSRLKINDKKMFSSKSIHKKIENVKRKQQSSLLLEKDNENEIESTPPPTDTIDIAMDATSLSVSSSPAPAASPPPLSSYEVAMAKLCQESESALSISHKTPSLEEFLDIWDDSWTDHQILAYFLKYLSDPRVVTLNLVFNETYHGENMYIPRDIWQIIVSFEFGAAHKQIKRRYYDWISFKRNKIYWIPFILGCMEFFGVSFIVFYVIVSGSTFDTDSTNPSSFIDGHVVVFAALFTAICAMLHTAGAVTAYCLARHRYSDKLKRFKRIIHLNHISQHAPARPAKIDADDDDDDNNANSNADDQKEENEGKEVEYGEVNDLPNVEIDFNIQQVPQQYRHLFISRTDIQRRRQRRDRNAEGTDGHAQRDDDDDDNDGDDNQDDEKYVENDDADNEDDGNDGDDGNENEEEHDSSSAEYDDEYKRMKMELRLHKRLKYMMGIQPPQHKKSKLFENDSDEDSESLDEADIFEFDDDGETSPEELKLILSVWEIYITFQRWINISSLVVTDNLRDLYLICFVLHKYLFVICITIYVFGSFTIPSLLPFIIFFISYSYLRLMVLDRISAKRAILYLLTMIGCTGIVIGGLIGILSVLSYLFAEDESQQNLDTSPTMIDNIGDDYNGTIYTTVDPEYDGMTTTLIMDVSAASDGTWWITDFFYPLLAFILCSNTLKKIKNGFDNNLPEIKYTLWTNCCFVLLIMMLATNAASWNNAVIKGVILLLFVYIAYLLGQQRFHQAVTRLKKIDYTNKYLERSHWVKTQLLWSWLGQLSKRFE